MLKFTAMMMPKCSALTPAASTTGRSSGVRMRIAAGGSRKLPASNNPTLTNNSVCQCGKWSALTALISFCGMPLVVISHAGAGDDDQNLRNQYLRTDDDAPQIGQVFFARDKHLDKTRH